MGKVAIIRLKCGCKIIRAPGKKDYFTHVCSKHAYDKHGHLR